MKYLIDLLILLLLVVYLLALKTPADNLSIIACDVGQGDAILVQKGNNQILIDGGPDNSVLTCLGKYMPFWDRTIELVILTHPEKDHFGGLIDVFQTYKVDKFGSNNDKSSSLDYEVLINEVGGSGTDSITLTDGVSLRLGMIYLDILHPAIDNKDNDLNNNGVVVFLKYDNFKALFPADIGNEVSDSLSLVQKIQNINYIKVNHHGSKNGLSEKLLQITNPDVAVVSVGGDNRYGHPHKEILVLLEKYNVEILRTDEKGDIKYIF